MFFIRYPDGTRDVLNEFLQPGAEAVAPAAQPSESVADVQPTESAREESAAQPSREYPCRAVITTKKKVKINVFIYAEDATNVSYRKTKSEKASIFRISRKNIANIKYQ